MMCIDTACRTILAGCTGIEVYGVVIERQACHRNKMTTARKYRSCVDL